MKHLAKALSVLLVIAMVCTLSPSVSLAATVRNASVTSNSVPSTMVAGTKYNVTVTIKNTGNDSWTAASGFSLVPLAGNLFANSSVNLGTNETVKPGGTKTFSLTLTAPATAGTYTASWRMSKGSTAFGSTFKKTIKVVPLTLNSIFILHTPTKLTYYRFEKLDISGLAVMGRYNDGSKRQVKVTTANITGFNSNYTGTYRLTVNVNGEKAAFSVTIWRMTLSSVKMTAEPKKKTYKVGEKLDFTGMAVSGTYINGRVKALSPASAAVSGFNNTKVANGQTVTLSFAGKTVKFIVNVIANDLMNAQAAAHASLVTTLGTYSKANYSNDGWAALNKAKTDGDKAIDAATTITLVNAAKAAAIKAMDNVKTLAEEVQALAEAKTSAHTALNTAFAGYDQADYHTAEWTALTKAKTDGDTAINAATTVALVTSAKNTAINAMKAVKVATVVDLANAKAAAHVALDSLLSSYIAADYSAANWALVLKAKSDGDAAIDAADTVAKVNTARTNALNAMDAVKSLADGILDTYKATAHTSLNGVLATYAQANYSTANWTALTKAKADGDKAIDSATSFSGVDSAKSNAIAAMAAIKTRSQEAQELANAKTAAHSALSSALNTYAVGDYSPSGWLSLNAAKTAGDAAIDAATTPAGVADAKTNALNAMDNVRTLAEEAQELDDAKAAAHAALTTALSSYNVANYSAANWTALNKAKTDGDDAIDAAATKSEVNAAKAAAISNMASVKTLAVQLTEAKSSAHALLISMMAFYHQADYSSANWTTLTTAKANGDTAIDASTTIDQVSIALNAAIAAMDAVKTLAEEP